MHSSDGSVQAVVSRESINEDLAASATDRVRDLAYGFLHSAVVLSAVELDVFSHLASGPADVETLRCAVGIHERGARDFFDALTAYGLLERVGADVYANSALADRYLDRGKPEYRGAMLDARRSYRIWAELPEALRTGCPQNEIKDGSEFFDAIYRDPDSLRRYHRGMLAQNANAAAAVAQRFAWNRVRRFVDLGTGHGGLPVAVARAHPHVRGVGVDSPLLRPIYEEYVASHGLEDRLGFVAGDFFADPLPRADVLVMGHILHNWSLDEKRLLIHKAFDSLPPHGVLVVYEKLLDDERSDLSALLSSLNQLLENSGGFEFTAGEIRAWLHDAGFARVDISRLVDSHSIVVAAKQDGGGAWIQ